MYTAPSRCHYKPRRNLGGGSFLTDELPLRVADDVVPATGAEADAVLADPAVAGLVVLPGRVGLQRSSVGAQGGAVSPGVSSLHQEVLQTKSEGLSGLHLSSPAHLEPYPGQGGAY